MRCRFEKNKYICTNSEKGINPVVSFQQFGIVFFGMCI